jgi:subtilisin family serine protease
LKRIIFLICILTGVLCLSSIPHVIASPEDPVKGENDPGLENQDELWVHWMKDENKNRIDDAIELMQPEDKIDILINYEYHPDEVDIERLSELDFNVWHVYNVFDTIGLKDVTVSDVRVIADFQGVKDIIFDGELPALLDVSSRSIKSRDSTEYSPETATDIGYLGTGITVAILDSGVDDSGPTPPGGHTGLNDLDDDSDTDDPKFIAGNDYTRTLIYNGDDYALINPNDEGGHGTHVAGIAIGTGDGAGDGEYRGVAPQSRLADVKVMENYGLGSISSIEGGIDFCIRFKDDTNIRVLSMSIGGPNSDGDDDIAHKVNEAVYMNGLVVVGGSGNDGQNRIPPIAAADGAICVGSINDHGTVDRTDDTISAFSNFGPRDNGTVDITDLKPDVVAPGELISSAMRDSPNAYQAQSGTSMSTPHVAGVVALMLEANPFLSPDRVREILRETAWMPAGVEPSYPEIDPVYNIYWGWGIVDAYEAVRVAAQEDNRPPIISDVSTEVSGNTVTINWHTHKAANSIVEYGITGGSLNQQVEDLDTYVFDHTVVITDLEQATNYSYRISGYDEQGNGPGQTGIIYFETEVLPDTTPPNILSINSFPSYSTCTIMWETDEDSDSLVEYGDVPELGLLKENDGEFGKDHSVTLTNLEPGTTYYFRVNSTDASDNTNHSIVATFITSNEPADPPYITQGPDEVDKTETSITIEWKTNKPTNSVVSYRAESEDWKAIPEPQGQFQIDHSIPITGLSPSTQYYYKIEFEDSESNSDEYVDGAFVTEGPPDLTPPGIESGPEVIILTDNSATIVWVTDEESDSLVRYGITESYGLEEPADGPTDEYVTVHNLTLTGLSHSTTYHFQVESRDTSPNKNEATSGDYTFTTKPKADLTKPEIIAGPTVLVVGEDTATIVWTTDEESDTVLHYGEDDSYGQTASDPTLVIGHDVTLTGLIPSTTYHFKVRSTDSSGNWKESQDREFTTLDIIIPIDIEFLNIANGEIIKGVKTVEARISGGEGLIIHSVRYKIDDGAWENLGSGSAFSITIDSDSLDEGEHTLYVEVTVGKLSQEVTMQEDVAFVVEHEEVDNSIFFIAIGIALVIVSILGAAIFVRNSAVKKRKERAEATEMEPFGASPFTPMDFSSDTDIGFGFIPEEEPVTVADMDEDISFTPDIDMEETELGISFVPDAPVLLEEPGITFVPDIAPVSFDVFAEEPEPDYSPMDKVRCPKCKRTFETDLSSDVACPHCGFNAEVKTW